MARRLVLAIAGVSAINILAWSCFVMANYGSLDQAAERASPKARLAPRSVRVSPTPVASPASNLSFDVDPFIGTDGYGHTVPGAKVPFGMIYLTPVSRRTTAWEYTGGYRHRDKTLYGVAHTAVSGTGIQLGLDFVVRISEKAESILKETATPGHYTVTTATASIDLVAGRRYGIHRYTFAASPATLRFDGPVRVQADANGSCVFHANATGRTIWATYPIHLFATADRPCRALGPGILAFATRPVEVHVAISYVDEEGARNNLADELTTFDGLSARATVEWTRRLRESYRALNQSASRGRVFDTALYHMFVSPYLHSDADGRFNGPDGRLHYSESEFYTFLSTWDTYRTWGPLMCKIAPDIMRGIVDTSMMHFEITGTFPRWTYAGRETNCMPGMHSITLCYQAAAHGLLGANETRRLYDAMVETILARSMFTTTRRVNGELAKIVQNDGVLYANEGDTQTISQMLEYAIIFSCVAKLGARYGDSPVVARAGRWSMIYRRLYDPRTRLLTGIARNGARVVDTRPYHASNTHLFTEGSQMHWIFHVMHDLPGMIELMGREVVLGYLEDIFTKDGTSEVPDVTGLIGMYAHGNEPSHHLAFLLLLLGKTARGLHLIERIRAMYTTASDGLCGNDDAGQMSAWYVAASVRLYPIDPTSAAWIRF